MIDLKMKLMNRNLMVDVEEHFPSEFWTALTLTNQGVRFIQP